MRCLDSRNVLTGPVASMEQVVIAIEPLRIGIVGAGRIAEAHFGAYRRLPGSAVVRAIVSSTRERAVDRAHGWGVKHAYSSIDELFKQNAVDAVDICVPHHLHRYAVQRACEHGKHILLEKPIARSVEEADQILGDVERAGVVLMVAHNHLFNPLIQKAKAILDEGLIGDVYLFSAISSGWFLFSKDDFRKSSEQTGGGAFIDTGTHFVYVLQYLLGSICSVAAEMGRRVRDDMGGEDTAIVTMRFESGVLGSVTVTYASKVPSWKCGFPDGWVQSLDIFGTAGTLRISLTQNKLVLFSEGRAPPESSELAPGWIEIGVNNAYERSYNAMVAHFVESVRSGEPPRVGGKEGRLTLEVIDAVHRSATDGRAVRIGRSP